MFLQQSPFSCFSSNAKFKNEFSGFPSGKLFMEKTCSLKNEKASNDPKQTRQRREPAIKVESAKCYFMSRPHGESRANAEKQLSRCEYNEQSSSVYWFENCSLCHDSAFMAWNIRWLYGNTPTIGWISPAFVILENHSANLFTKWLSDTIPLVVQQQFSVHCGKHRKFIEKIETFPWPFNFSLPILVPKVVLLKICLRFETDDKT